MLRLQYLNQELVQTLPYKCVSVNALFFFYFEEHYRKTNKKKLMRFSDFFYHFGTSVSSNYFIRFKA